MHNQAEKTFSRNIMIWYVFYNNLGSFTDFQKLQVFFWKRPIYFLKKNNFRNYLRNPTISVAVYGQFAKI